MNSEIATILQTGYPAPGDTRALIFFLALITWSLIWKGWALWLASRRGEKVWFIFLLIANTLGILDIIYIFFVAKRKDTK